MVLVKTVRCLSRGRALIKTGRHRRDGGGVGQDGTLSKPGESVDQYGTSPARRGRCWSRRYVVQAGGER